MIISKFFQKMRVVCCKMKKHLLFGGVCHIDFVLPRLSFCEPLSEFEIQQCKEALNPIGYTIEENITGNEIIVSRLLSDEQKQELKEVLHKILQQCV